MVFVLGSGFGVYIGFFKFRVVEFVDSGLSVFDLLDDERVVMKGLFFK